MYIKIYLQVTFVDAIPLILDWISFWLHVLFLSSFPF